MQTTGTSIVFVVPNTCTQQEAGELLSRAADVDLREIEQHHRPTLHTQQEVWGPKIAVQKCNRCALRKIKQSLDARVSSAEGAAALQDTLGH
mmetsp:Transcript_11212/g.13252  ORF Transcript_11212/g.13252 Transcript_11212/m.13252 type:complete len:92 (+) Transcript_11212:16-291(+)